jgi:hypothetical protein
MKATASDGKNIITNINYYGVDKNPFTGNDNVVCIMNNGGVKTTELEDEPINGGKRLPSIVDRAEVKSIYFKENEFEKIGENFNHRNYLNLTSIDFSSFKKIKTVGKNFMEYITQPNLTSIDLSSFSSVETIGENFLYGCSLLTSIDLSNLDNINKIGGESDSGFYSDFLTGCKKLIFVK